MTDRAASCALTAVLRHGCGFALIGLVLVGGTAAWTSPTTVAITLSTARNAGSTGPAPINIRVSHDRYAAYAEPYLAVNPRNPHNLLGAAQLFPEPTSLPRAGAFASFDGGHTWPRQGPLPGPPNLPAAQDTTVAFTNSGVGFISAMSMPIVNGRPGDVTGISIWRTDNGGRSFQRPIVLARRRLLDHPWLTADPYGKTLYLVWGDLVRNAIMFSRSTDSGRSFSPGRAIFQGGVVSDQVVAAGPGGRIAVAFYYRHDGAFFSIGVVSSSNRGRSFSTLRPIPQTLAGRLLYAGRTDPSSRLGAAMDSHSGMLSVVYASYGSSGGSHTDVVLSRSPDGGRTWLGPVRVTDDPTGPQTINQQPQVAVSGGGTVYVSYLAQRGERMDLYLAGSTSRGGRQRGMRVTSRSFDPSLGIRTFRPGFWWIGDYQGLATGPSAIYPFWNDTRSGRLAIFTALVPESFFRRG